MPKIDVLLLWFSLNHIKVKPDVDSIWLYHDYGTQLQPQNM